MQFVVTHRRFPRRGHDELLTAHAALVAIDSDHDHKPIGRLIYAELGIDQALRSVAVLDTDRFATIDRPVYFSGEFQMRGDVDKSFYVAPRPRCAGCRSPSSLRLLDSRRSNREPAISVRASTAASGL